MSGPLLALMKVALSWPPASPGAVVIGPIKRLWYLPVIFQALRRLSRAPIRLSGRV